MGRHPQQASWKLALGLDWILKVHLFPASSVAWWHGLDAHLVPGWASAQRLPEVGVRGQEPAGALGCWLSEGCDLCPRSPQQVLVCAHDLSLGWSWALSVLSGQVSSWALH